MNFVIPPASGPARPRVSSDPSRFRSALLVLGFLLGVAGLWLFVSDLFRPGPIGFPPDRAVATAEATAASARTAAQRGMIRGDLWADAAFAEAAAHPWPERSAPTDKVAAGRLERVRDAIETSLALAPVNAEGWLLLALLPGPSGNEDPRVASRLKMAYFTAPNNIALAPRRVELAASSSALADPEIQDFIKADIRRILAGTPQQRATIVAAYRNSPPENRARFETLVADVDSGFARMLRPGLQK